MFLTTPSTIWPSSSCWTISERCSARLSSRMARRDTTILPRRLSILRMAKGCSTFISGPISRIGRMSTCERGRNATAPSRSTVKPPLTWLKIVPSTRWLLLYISSSLTQLSSRRAFSRESTAAPIGLETDIDDRQILFDRDHLALDHGAFHRLVVEERVHQEGLEIFLHCSLRTSQTHLHMRPVVG